MCLKSRGRREMEGGRGCTLGASDDASAFGLQVCIVALLCSSPDNRSGIFSDANNFQLSSPLSLSSLRLSFFFLFSVSLSFSLLATRNRIKFAPWEFQLLFFKNDASSHLTPRPPSFPLLLPFPLSKKEHRSPALSPLSISLSASVALELVSCVVIHSANCLLPALTLPRPLRPLATYDSGHGREVYARNFWVILAKC